MFFQMRLFASGCAQCGPRIALHAFCFGRPVMCLNVQRKARLDQTQTNEIKENQCRHLNEPLKLQHDNIKTRSIKAASLIFFTH